MKFGYSKSKLVNSKIQQIVQNKFVRNVAIVATGTAGAQAITMAFAPFITRIYGPEAFGLLGIFMALAMMISPIVALTYPIAIVLPKEDHDAKGLVWLSLYIAFIMSALIAILLFFWGEWFLTLLGSQSILPYAMLLPLSMFFAAILQIAEQWLIRKKHFKITAKVAVYKSLIVGSLQTGIGLIKPIGGVLIIVATIGSALQAFMLFNGAKKANLKETAELENSSQSKTINTNKNLKQLANTHRDFPIFRAPQVFINAISISLPVLMLASFFGPATAGFYSIAMSVLGLPATLLGKSVNDVFYQKITEVCHKNENLNPLLFKATLTLALISVIPFSVIILFGPWLFSTVFGQNWEVAGEYAQYLSLWLYVSLVARPAIAAIPAMQLQKFLLIYEIFSVCARVAALIIGFQIFNNDIGVVALFSFINALIYGFLIVLVIQESSKIKNHKYSL